MRHYCRVCDNTREVPVTLITSVDTIQPAPCEVCEGEGRIPVRHSSCKGKGCNNPQCTGPDHPTHPGVLICSECKGEGCYPETPGARHCGGRGYVTKRCARCSGTGVVSRRSSVQTRKTVKRPCVHCPGVSEFAQKLQAALEHAEQPIQTDQQIVTTPAPVYE